MARLALYDPAGVERAARDVDLPSGAAWQTPTPRPNTVVGATLSNPVSDVCYIDCTFTASTSSGTSAWNGLQRCTIIRPTINLPTIIRGWRDVWFGGSPGQLVNAGPRTDGNDLLQIKTHGSIVPDGVTIAWVDYHDVSRPSGSSAHPDAIQLMCGRRVTIAGSTFRNMGNAVQPVFLRDAGSSAGGGPIEDTTITDCGFSGITHFYSVRIAGDEELDQPGRFVPTRTVLRNLDLGGKNAAVDVAAQNAGLTVENLTNGVVVP